MWKYRMQTRTSNRRSLAGSLVLAALAVTLATPAAHAQDDTESPPRIGSDGAGPGNPGSDSPAPAKTDARQKPPVIAGSTKVNIDFVDTPLTELVKYMAEITGRNFILTDDLKGSVTIISHKPVTVAEAYEAFLSALSQAGYTTVTSGQATQVVALGDAASTPLRVYEGGEIPYTDNYVTQIIQMENVSVTDIQSVVQGLAGKSAKIIPYPATNTLIITDAGSNIRKIYRIITQLDVASPKSKLEIIPIVNSQASDIKTLIEQLYNVNATSTSSASSSSSAAADRPTGRRRRAAAAEETASTGATVSGRRITSSARARFGRRRMKPRSSRAVMSRWMPDLERRSSASFISSKEGGTPVSLRRSWMKRSNSFCLRVSMCPDPFSRAGRIGGPAQTRLN